MDYIWYSKIDNHEKPLAPKILEIERPSYMNLSTKQIQIIQEYHISAT